MTEIVVIKNKTMQNAIILTGGSITNSDAKTAHGLIRTGRRFNIVGVIDKTSYGEDAGNLLENKPRNIPVYSSVKEFIKNSSCNAEYAIVGIAVPGGILPAELLGDIKESIEAGLSVVSGLHEYLSENPVLADLAQKNNVRLLDIRKPRPKKELKFWTGEIFRVTAPIIAVLGTDCCVGKRTTAAMITDKMVSSGINAQMVFTGQTGWLQGYKYGFILDSAYNDFVSGELENAVVRCYDETNPDIILLEGQSSLGNPSGPCGAEFLLSARAKGVILQHSPARRYYEGQEHLGMLISLEKEIELIRVYGSEIIAITLNTNGLDLYQALEYKEKFEKEFNLPVVLPLIEGVDALIKAIDKYVADYRLKENSVMLK